ncbi:hypothetical protein IFHNHDMJ_02347 [Synechococcus sp. CBW1107]|nr:hypothetical protein IFHNHDMJ_02347 [Synechococcus sp. CBW1107]
MNFRLPSCRYPALSVQSKRGQSSGFNLLEVLLAVAIAGLTMAAISTTFSSQLSTARRSSDRSQIESVIAEDLAWIRNYATIWRMESGPYNLTTTQTKASSFASSPSVSYSPDPSLCSSGGLASSFVSDAASVTLSPARPNSIPTTSGSQQSLTIPGGIPGVSLNRRITFSSTTPDDNRIYVYYNLSGENSSALSISRESSIYLEAASWCKDPTP